MYYFKVLKKGTKERLEQKERYEKLIEDYKNDKDYYLKDQNFCRSLHRFNQRKIESIITYLEKNMHQLDYVIRNNYINLRIDFKVTSYEKLQQLKASIYDCFKKEFYQLFWDSTKVHGVIRQTKIEYHLTNYLENLTFDKRNKLMLDLIFNQSSIEDLMKYHYTELRKNLHIKCDEDIFALSKLLESYENGIKTLEDEKNGALKELYISAYPLISRNFSKGKKTIRKDTEIQQRTNEIYLNIEACPYHEITWILLYEFRRRHLWPLRKDSQYWINYYYFPNKQKEQFLEHKVTYQKSDKQNLKVPQDLHQYRTKFYEYNFFKPSIEYSDESAILLKLNMNLPRYELEKIFSIFLDQHHKNSSIKKSNKQLEAKIRKIVHILYIYDCKRNSFSNEEIIYELEQYDEYLYYKKHNRTMPSEMKTTKMHPKTLTNYLRTAQKLIDQRGYEEIAKGHKSIYDII